MADPESLSEHQVFSFQNMLFLAFTPLVNMTEQPTGNPEGQHVHRIIRVFFSNWLEKERVDLMGSFRMLIPQESLSLSLHSK